ncbi:hypothetical protein CDIOL_03820 [Clostridium diolis]|jgi:hypothetical protein|uniref:Uncharacterized protein n=1 Tax=Clostridium diolis TaxID=223919 RepID=A0AAV3VUR2_9CLOT|nr:hypothetical protein CDIOL_03820 [Clostridium diolis]
MQYLYICKAINTLLHKIIGQNIYYVQINDIFNFLKSQSLKVCRIITQKLLLKMSYFIIK